jgi:hypothetical protein
MTTATARYTVIRTVPLDDECPWQLGAWGRLVVASG